MGWLFGRVRQTGDLSSVPMILRTALPDAFGAEETVASCRLEAGTSVSEYSLRVASPARGVRLTGLDAPVTASSKMTAEVGSTVFDLSIM